MSEHRATIDWRLESTEFSYESYNRAHTWTFDGGVRVPGAAAPEGAGMRGTRFVACVPPRFGSVSCSAAKSCLPPT